MPQHDIPIYKPKKYSDASELINVPTEHHPFIIVGAGPIGLALALELARKGHQVTVLTSYDFIASGSKAICFSKQSLDIFDRLGVGNKVIEKGITWNVGKVFWGANTEPVYQFDLLPVKDQKNPAFVNIQQYYVEEIMIDALEAMDNVTIRWGHTVNDVNKQENGATLSVSTRQGTYQVDTGYVLACDGSRSKVRDCLGLDFQGRLFEDNFLIADVKFKQERPSERWFWFDPPFNPGNTALIHKQPDGVWRLDFQLGWNIDRAEAIKSENIAPYIKGMLGQDTEYEEEWLSIYTFQCRRMERFVHGPVIFVGDSAHLVSPFGARGANGGFSDAENIGWKLDLILTNKAGKPLLETYNFERVMGSDENILNSSRSTDFMTPKSKVSESFRDAVLALASDYTFARPFVNSGRLSTPTPYYDSPLSTPDTTEWHAKHLAPGHPCVDAPVENVGNEQWLLQHLGDEFTVLHFGNTPPLCDLKILNLPTKGTAAKRYDAQNGATYLIRPDQVVAARWKHATSDDIQAAYKRAIGSTL